MIKTAVLLAAMLAGAVAYSAEPPVLLDRVYAIANGEVVLQSTYERELKVMREQIASDPNQPQPSPEEFTEMVIERLIQQSLQYQLAERHGIRKNDEDINARLEFMAQQMRLSEQQMIDRYRSQGWDYVHLRETIRRQLIIEELQQGMVYQLIKVSDQEIEDYLRSPEGIQAIGPEYHLGYIKVAIKGDVEAARTSANAVLERARQGVDFTQLARTQGIRDRSWDLGWRRIDAVPTLFVNSVPDLDVNETADLLQTDSAFHIVKLFKRRGPAETWQDQVHVRHILIEPGKIRNFDQARLLAEELYRRIGEGEDMAELARAYSGDPGSVLNGGLLEWQPADAFAPEFKKAVDAVELDTLTGPVKTQFGWHVLRVEGRRIEDVSKKQRQNLAVQALFSRRYEDALDKWMREMRRDAYVEIIDRTEPVGEPEPADSPSAIEPGPAPLR